MSSIVSVFRKIYKQRFTELKKSFQNSPPMKYRGILALVLISIFSTFFVFAQVQASRSVVTEPKAQKIIIKSSVTPTPTLIISPSISPLLSVTPTGIPVVLTSTPTITKTPTPTPINNRSLRPSPTPTKKTTNTPSPTKFPTTVPTYIPEPTATPTPTQSISDSTPFSFSLSPQGSFTPNARGEGNGTFTKPSGFWSFTFSGSFTKLMPNREYQLWLCGANCSSHTALRFNTNNEGSGGFSSANITHNQAKDPLSRIVVWEASVPGIIHEDENSCVMVSMNHTPCLQTPYFLQ